MKDKAIVAINKIKKLFLLPFLFLFYPITVSAHCPLCTAAIGVATVSAKYYGMDLSVVGVFVGAFAISTGLWVGKKFKNYFKFQLPLIVLLSFVLTVVPIMALGSDSVYLPILWFGEAGSLFNKVYWVDKLLFGSIIGSITSIFAFGLHDFVKKLHGKVLFPFQGITLTLLLLALAGLLLQWVKL